MYGGKTPKSSLNIGGANPQFRGNLILAEDPADPAFTLGAFTNLSSSDLQRLPCQARSAKASLRLGVSAIQCDKSPDFSGELEKRSYATLAEYVQATGQDAHSVEVNYDVFENLSPAIV